MTAKKIVAKVAKILRKETGYDFVHTLKLAKAILRNKTWQYTDKHYELGFVYRYERGITEESLTFQGTIRHSKDELKEIEIPQEVYKLKELYTKRSA